jgi:hypothetical protein
MAMTSGAGLADNIDRELVRQAPKIMQYLRDKGYKNVGVLTFRMQRGDETTTYRGALINSNMAERLEQALILAIDPEHPINIISQARTTAVAKIRDAGYKTPEDRQKLFGLRYELPLDQENKYVTADAFLTGKVWVSPNFAKVVIGISVFDKHHPEPFPRILSFEVASDRFMLADVGRGFSLSQRGLKFARGADDDDDILKSVSQEEDEKEQAKKDEEKTEDTSADTTADLPEGFPVKLTIRYDDMAQDLKPDSAGGDTNFTVVDPKEGQKVAFDIKNVSNERLGVVLTVNGYNTLYEEEGDFAKMTRWIIEPNKEYRVRGFYQKDKKTFYPIEGVSDDRSKTYWSDLGDAAGLIHLYVFRTRPEGIDLASASVSRGSESFKPVGARGVDRKPAKSWLDLQRQIVSNGELARKFGGRGLMMSASELQKQELTTGDLGAVHNTDTMIIRYYSIAAEEQKSAVEEKKDETKTEIEKDKASE